MNRLTYGGMFSSVVCAEAPENVDYLHTHFAAAGCYAAKVERAELALADIKTNVARASSS